MTDQPKLSNPELQKMVEVALNNTISISLIYAHNTDHIQQTLTALRDEVMRQSVIIDRLEGGRDRVCMELSGIASRLDKQRKENQ